MKRRVGTSGVVFGAFMSALLAAAPAGAVQCDELPLTNKVFGAGSSVLTPTLKRVAVASANDADGATAEKTTVLYSDPGDCESYADFVAGASTRSFKYWIAGSTADQICEARDGGQPLDFAYAQGFDLCEAARPESVKAFPGPAQGLNLVTGLTSNETSISAEALYLVFGLGPSGQASPWTDGAGVFPSASVSFATLLLGRAINVAPSAFFDWDVPVAGGSLITMVKTYSAVSTVQAAQALSYVPSSTADVNRANVKTLAYQHYGQACGVYPDSSATTFDKLNVRLGKYWLWTAGQFFARVDEDGALENDRVGNLIGWFDGARLPGTTLSALDEVIEAGNVPDCAMQVRRDGTLGALSSYAPAKPCTGRFERVANGSTEHEPCAADAECSGETPACNFGFCEPYRDAGASEG